MKAFFVRLFVFVCLLLGTANLVLFFFGKHPHDPMSLVAGLGALAWAFMLPRMA